MDTFKVLNLAPEQLPIYIRLKVGDELREYILLTTKQGKLLLNKFDGERRNPK